MESKIFIRVCVQCGKLLPLSERPDKKYCSRKCANDKQKDEYRKMNSRCGNNSSDTGAASEHIAIADLILMRYDVYRAVSPSAPFDIIAVKDGQFLRMEVKTCYPKKGGGVSRVYGDPEKCDHTISVQLNPDVVVEYFPPLDS